MPQLVLGERLPSGERVGVCPMCGKRGKIAVSLIEEDSNITLPLMVVKVTHRKLDANGEPLQCARRYTQPLLVDEAARLCGVRPVTIRAAERRGLLKSTRRKGYPIEFAVIDFAEYFNRADGRRRKESSHESLGVPARR